MPGSDDDDTTHAKLKAVADKAQEVGKKSTHIWVAGAAFVLGFVLGLFV